MFNRSGGPHSLSRIQAFANSFQGEEDLHTGLTSISGKTIWNIFGGLKAKWSKQCVQIGRIF